MNRFDDDDSSPTFGGAVLNAALWIVNGIFSIVEPIANALLNFVIGCIVSLFWLFLLILSFFFEHTIMSLIIISILSIILALLLPALMLLRVL